MQISALETPPMPSFKRVRFPWIGEGSFDRRAGSIWKEPLFFSGAGINLRNDDGSFVSI